jgi:hypothetical protein
MGYWGGAYNESTAGGHHGRLNEELDRQWDWYAERSQRAAEDSEQFPDF